MQENGKTLSIDH